MKDADNLGLTRRFIRRLFGAPNSLWRSSVVFLLWALVFGFFGDVIAAWSMLAIGVTLLIANAILDDIDRRRCEERQRLEDASE